MHSYLNWFEAYMSVLFFCIILCFVLSIKGYYLCSCNISFCSDADILQSCSSIEKSISKHIFAEPQGALLLVWKVSFWWCVRSGLIL